MSDTTGADTPLFEGVGDEVFYLLGLSLPVLVWVLCCFGHYWRSPQRGRDAQTGLVAGPQAPRGHNVDCPICLEQDGAHGVTTNCGHCFCGPCFLLLVSGADPAGDVQQTRCPLCRRHVTMAHVEEWTPEEKGGEEGKRILRKLNEYNRRFSGRPRSWVEILRDVPYLVRRLCRQMSAGKDTQRQDAYQSIFPLTCTSMMEPFFFFCLSLYSLSLSHTLSFLFSAYLCIYLFFATAIFIYLYICIFIFIILFSKCVSFIDKGFTGKLLIY